MNIQKIIEEKQQAKKIKKRIKKLPDDYQFVYKEIQKYIFKVCILNEKEAVELFEGLLELFEEGVVEDKEVLDITGKDVAMFCDNLITNKETYDDLVQKEVKQKVLKALKDSKK